MPENKGKDKYIGIIEKAKKRKKTENKISVEDEKVKIVIFSLCGSLYAFYGKYIKSILPYNLVTYVPGCPESILGIINVRGDIESVLNIHYFMGKTDINIDNSTRIVIAETSFLRSGILVDSVEDVIDVSVNKIAPPVSTIEASVKEFVVGELDYQGGLITIFDVEKIFGRISV